MFSLLVAAASVVAGAIASVAGFGIGSLLTPIFNLRDDMRVAVAAASVPHAVATAVRLWMLRRDVDRGVLKTFGVMSAAGGLIGAVLQQYATGASLTFVFAALLALAGLAGLTGASQRVRLGRVAGWIAGILSGALGGLVGNQGGIRSAALLGYELPPRAFVATATAVGLIVDAARVPVYIVMERQALLERASILAMATVAVVVGTLAGKRVLERLPPPIFRRLVGSLVLLLAVYMFWRASVTLS